MRTEARGHRRLRPSAVDVDPNDITTIEPPRRVRRPLGRRVVVVFGLLLLALLGSVALFLTWEVNGHWDYVLPRRTEQLVALTVVAVAIAISTVIFMTLTQNRILTPAVMGFDAMYVLLATMLVLVMGGVEAERLSPLTRFSLNSVLLIGVATLVYRWVLGDGTRGLYTLLLVGVIAGTLFGSITSFLFRVMEPNEFDLLMDDLFASFNRLDTDVLRISLVPLAVATIAAFRMVPVLDVLGLGRERAIALGVDYAQATTRLLLIVTTLVAVSTALVGPIVFLGLLVANLAMELTGTHRHAINMVAASLISITALVLGQALLQHVLEFNATLGSIINLVGGAYFILLLMGKARA